MEVRPFKKGPDYIDPMWLTRAGGNPCVNLDFNTMSREEILQRYVRHQVSDGVSIIEGNKGLFDGLDLHGGDSNAELARLLQAPVILVVDAEGMTRGLAPLIQGYMAFERDVNICGLVLNNLGGNRHESKLRDIVEHYTDLELLGAIQRNSGLKITERHLGLTTEKEDFRSSEHIDAMAEAVSSQVNLDRLLELARSAPVLSMPPAVVKPRDPLALSIGVARDSAFCFYYADDIAAIEQRGARVRYFDTLNDGGLPDVDALFIGGGFPETHAKRLENNLSMRSAVSEFAASGKPVYAECGGLMYLSRQIKWQGSTSRMVGSIPADIEMHERPVGRGYVVLEPTSDHPWLSAYHDFPASEIKAHEFHYSSLTNLGTGVRYAYRVKRGHGVDGNHDGILYKNIFASYAHLHNTLRNPWIDGFLESVNSDVMSRSKSDNQRFYATS